MTNQTGRFAALEHTEDLDALDNEIRTVVDELAALEQEAGGLRYRIRELQTREGYEPQKVAAEGGTKPLFLRLAAIGREKDEGETRLLELRIRRLQRDSEPSRAEQKAARDDQDRIRDEEKRLKQEEEATRDRYNRACWSVNAYDDEIRCLWGELRQRRGEGG
jgi:chromosome segregation ATPase